MNIEVELAKSPACTMNSESSTIDWRFVTFGYIYLTAQNILSMLSSVF
jgi:hypothetical protein